MNDNLLTVAQVARRAGITKQAVYQRLNKDLNKYVKVVDSKKMLDISVLKEFELKQVEQVNNQELNNSLTSTLTTLNSVIDTLRQQLDVKDGQIKDLNNRLEQALNNQSQDNYIMAAQTKMIEDGAGSPIEESEQVDSSSVGEPTPKIKPAFWRKLFKK